MLLEEIFYNFDWGADSARVTAAAAKATEFRSFTLVAEKRTRGRGVQVITRKGDDRWIVLATYWI